jgi:gliding motility-associated-like protein
MSDTLKVLAEDSPSFDFGLDYSIPCNTTTTLDPAVTGGLGNAFYTYAWSNNSANSSIIVAQGTYYLEVDDGTGCYYRDTITITEDAIPHATISGGGSVCDDGTTTDITFTFNGLLPWDLIYTNGTASIIKNDILISPYTISTSIAGPYSIELADDINDCIADTSGSKVEVIVNPLPIAVITPSEATIYVGDEVELTAGSYAYYEWYTENDSLISTEDILTVEAAGKFYIWIEDINGCVDVSDLATVNAVPLTQLFVPSIFTPNDDEHNELFVIHGTHIVTFNIKIFDRWGEQLFESNSRDKYWDGIFENKKVQQASYYYQIEVMGEDKNVFKKGGVIEVVY